MEKFHVSKCNVRYGQPFGQDDNDKRLIYQLRNTKKLVEPFKARPEENGFGVYAGGRRFLASVQAGFKSFAVGKDVIIVDITREDAIDESIIENIGFLRKSMNPITRAKRLNERISSSPGGLRAYGRRVGISPSTLSEWLKLLELSDKMQEAVAEGLMYFTDALNLTKMELGEITEGKLANTLKTDGFDAFQKELERHTAKRLKRGIPKDKYLIARITFDKYYPQDMTAYKKLEELAKAKDMELNDFIKQEIIEPFLQKT